VHLYSELTKPEHIKNKMNFKKFLKELPLL